MAATVQRTQRTTPPREGMTWIPDGSFDMGSEDFYRPAARQGEAIDTSTSHIGFRCVVRA
jgi:formylglycine-generating enzyme required for sulfatase activity